MEEKFEVPKGVTIDIENRAVIVKGPKGQIKKDFDDPRFNRVIGIDKSGDSVMVKTSDESRKNKAMIGTIMAHLKNMSLGVTKGYSYKMKIVTTHFPITVAVSGKDIQVKNFFGEKNSRKAKIVGDTQVKVDKDTVDVTGINLEDVSQTAANIENACKLKGRDRRIFQDGVYMHDRHLQTGEAI